MLKWIGNLFGGDASNAGSRGERIAADWLRRERGFSVVAKNWRNPHDRRDEIDLVCRDGDVLVFVEVKTRAAGALVPGFHAVDARKKRVLRRAAQAFLASLPERPLTYRLDVVEVVGSADSKERPELVHFENIPLFGDRFLG